jgi:hypothetical protein
MKGTTAEQFFKVWPGGYYEGDPRDCMSPSTYRIYGYNSVLYTIELACIRPYVGPDTTALEIGPGRGAWSKAILARGCKKLYAIDAASSEHTGFHRYVGDDARAEYLVGSDFSLTGVPDGIVDFVFSFGVFCHLTPEQCRLYVASIARKMAPGAHGFLMIADREKYEGCRRDFARVSLYRMFAELPHRRWSLVRTAFLLSWRLWGNRLDLQTFDTLANNKAAPWYHWGLDAALAALREEGLVVVEPDVGVVARDPVIHFVKQAG